jgi:hypothetical protein
LERTTKFSRIFVRPVASAIRLPITPGTDISPPRSLPANCDWLKVSPSHLHPSHSQSNLLEHDRTSPNRATPNRKFASRVPSKTESHSQAITVRKTQFSSEEEKSYEFNNMLL